MGRAMGEAMAGVLQSGRHAPGWSPTARRADHFVGECYADYVAVGRGASRRRSSEQAEDSLSREVHVQNDAADELIKRVLSGDREAVELWYKTRAWVIAGQRKTLARLGIAFDRVFFESDFLAETVELTETGLRDGTLHAPRGRRGRLLDRLRGARGARARARRRPLDPAHALAHLRDDGARTRGHDLDAGDRLGVGRARDRASASSRTSCAPSSTAASIRAAASSTGWSSARSAR